MTSRERLAILILVSVARYLSQYDWRLTAACVEVLEYLERLDRPPVAAVPPVPAEETQDA